MIKEVFKAKGVKWNELRHIEKIAIEKQMPQLINDNSRDDYKYFYSSLWECWIITNAMEVPMQSNSMKGIIYE